MSRRRVLLAGLCCVTLTGLLPAAPDADEGWVADFLELDEQVGREDAVLVERVQQGVRAGAIAHGQALPESERLVVHFDRLLRESIGE